MTPSKTVCSSLLPRNHSVSVQMRNPCRRGGGRGGGHAGSLLARTHPEAQPGPALGRCSSLYLEREGLDQALLLCVPALASPGDLRNVEFQAPSQSWEQNLILTRPQAIPCMQTFRWREAEEALGGAVVSACPACSPAFW